MRQLIDVASLTGLENLLRADGLETASMWTSPEDWDIDEKMLGEWIAAAADGLAHAVVSACSIVDFRAVLIDGWLPEAVRQRLVDAVQHCLETKDLTGLAKPKVLPGNVGADARVLGAVSLPLSERFLVEPNMILNRA